MAASMEVFNRLTARATELAVTGGTPAWGAEAVNLSFAVLLTLIVKVGLPAFAEVLWFIRKEGELRVT